MCHTSGSLVSRVETLQTCPSLPHQPHSADGIPGFCPRQYLPAFQEILHHFLRGDMMVPVLEKSTPVSTSSCSSLSLSLTPQECSQRANNGRFTLRDLLMVPMQRVLKYHLLLQVHEWGPLGKGLASVPLCVLGVGWSWLPGAEL